MKYYEKAKLTQIIIDLIYLKQEMTKDGNVDNQSLKEIDKVIETLRYYLQFIK